MKFYLKILSKIFIISAVFVIVSIVLVTITSLQTQSKIHPDYWIFGTPEKAILLLLLAVYGLAVFNSVKKSHRTQKQQIKSASPNRKLLPTRLRRAGEHVVVLKLA